MKRIKLKSETLRILTPKQLAAVVAGDSAEPSGSVGPTMCFSHPCPKPN